MTMIASSISWWESDGLKVIDLSILPYMTELQIIQLLLCQGCNKPPERIAMHSDVGKDSFVINTYCCYCKEFVLPFLDNSTIGLAIYYNALLTCCDYITGAQTAQSPTATDWQLTGQLFSNAFGRVEATQPVFCDCGASSVGSNQHSSWCSLRPLLND